MVLGSYKQKMRSRVKAGENASIILERGALYSFLKNTAMVDFEGIQKSNGDSSHTFEYHPSGNKEYAQLWAPFYNSFYMNDNNGDSMIGGNLISMKHFINSLKAYKKRLFSINMSLKFIDIDYLQNIKPSGKLWQDSHVYTASIFKDGQKKIEKRGGEYIMFHSTHLVRK